MADRPSPLEYRPKAVSPVRRERSRTPRYVVGFLVVAIALFFGLACVPLWHTDFYIDTVTGSTTLKTTYLFCLHNTQYTPSGLQRRLEKSKIPWTPAWAFVSDTDHWLLGGTSRGGGTMPLIGRVEDDLRYYVYGATDAEVAGFVQILQNGTPAQEMAAIEAKIEPPADEPSSQPVDAR